MKNKRKRHDVAFKAKVGLEALQGSKTLAEIARDYEVHLTQIGQWKTIILDRLPDLFTHGPTAEVKQAEREVARLHEKVGELTMELDWLKKKSKLLEL